MPVSLRQAVRLQEGGGDPLPVGFATLEHAGIRPRRGQITMFYGYPGSGKTALALAWAVRMKVPTLFFSLDTDPKTMYLRQLAMATRRDQGDIEKADRAGEDFSAVDLGSIRYSFLPDPDPGGVDNEFSAYIEVHGEAPALVIVDNLLNVTSGDENEWSGMRAVMKVFHALSRYSGAAVWILHHASESTRDKPCPPRSAIQGKVSQLPSLILSVGQRTNYRGEVEMGVAKVKDRHGPADPSGDTVTWLSADLAAMQIFDSDYEAFAWRRMREIS